MGYPSAITAFSGPNNKFGVGGGDIILDNLKCTGTESSIFDCPHFGIWKNDCSHSEDAAVVCESKNYDNGTDFPSEQFLSIFNSTIVFCHFQSIPAVECEWSTWKISNCSETCDGGVRLKTRKKVKNEIGTICEGESTVQEACNTQNCPGTV